MSAEDLSARYDELQKKAQKFVSHYEEMTLKRFLEEAPPDKYATIIDLQSGLTYPYMVVPDINAFCDSENCKGTRLYKSSSSFPVSESWTHQFLNYTCRNCGSRTVRFALGTRLLTQPVSENPGTAQFLKVGQIPPFGPHTPARLIALIGPDREIFLQGRRAESRGLGIGAFAYYRRVVENQKNRIIAEISRVAKTVGCSEETSQLFEAAMKETRFKESIDMVKDYIPQTLLISGQNPLMLLHSSLSKGLHNADMSDEHCLKLAQSIRIVLAELAERASEALKDNKEIQSAISVLMAVPHTNPSVDSGSK